MVASPDPASGSAPSRSEEGADEKRVPIVALGASAGGLEALETFFDALPADTGMAFVVLMHLSPEHESNLAAIIGHHTELPVQTAEDGTVPEPNTVYVLPPKTVLKMDDGQLRLTDPEQHENQRTVIDTFLQTLAEERGKNAAAIVLSGTGTDGTQGLRALKEAGGFSMVQDPEEAAYDGMPRSALQTNLVDIVAPVGGLAARLAQFWTHPISTSLAEEPEEMPDEDEQAVRKILTQVYTEKGHDFTHYKRSTVLRRIGRRIAVNQVPSISDYLELLRNNAEEIDALFRELLICVTRFFRDEAAFEALAQTALSPLFQNKGFDDQVRVWTAGCATGEEAYSLAMLLHEQAEQQDRPPDLQVFATDLSGEALETARQGLYPESVVANLSAERRERYLVPEGTHYRVRQSLRERVLFAEHNLLEDPPFSKLDLVSCRNLLIYLNREMQEHIFELLHYALRPEGVLFLGMSESIGAAGGLFTGLEKEHSLYRRQPSSRDETNIPHFPLQKRLAQPPELSQPGSADSSMPNSVNELHRQLLVEEVASIVVNEDYDIVHLTDPAARYLEYQGGTPTHNVLEAAPKALRMELRGGLYRAFQKNAATEQRPVRTQIDGEPEWLRVRIRPAGNGKSFAQILITPTDPPDKGTEAAPEEEETSEHVAQLEEELRRTKEQLRTTIEEYETTTEELEASNEELLSMNEELQSKNEEIETSKEELQSVNEELKTTNQELKYKIEELRRANSDLQNFMAATDIATLFLDRELRIQRFTPRVQELFNIRQTDVGRPLADFSQKFEFDHLIDEAQSVLDRLQPVEKELQSEEGRWFLVRIRPYRTVDDKIDGVVITFVDVTDRKEAHLEAQRERQYAEEIVDTVRESLLVLDDDLRVQSANDSFYDTFETTPEETTGKLVYELSDGQWDIPELRELLEDILPKDTVINGFEVEQEFENLGPRIMHLNARQIDAKPLILLAIEDVTERRQAEQQLSERMEQLEKMMNIEGVGVLIFDEEGTLVDANDAFLDMHGYSREDVEARRLTWRDLTPPEYVEESEEQLEKLEETGRLGPYEKECIRKDGTRSWMLFAGARLSDGTIVEYCIDVSARKEAEQQLKEERNFVDSVLNTVGALVLVVDTEGRIVRFNKECENVTGYSADEVKGEEFIDLLIPPEERDKLRDVHADLLEGKPPDSQENQWVTKDGERRLIRWSNTVLTDDDGTVEYVIGTGIDITERRQLEREVITATDKERRRIGENLHDMLASQLTGTAMMVEALIRKVQDDNPEVAGEIQTVAEHIREASEQVRTLSHSLMPVEINDNQLVESLRQLAERQERLGTFSCTFEAGPSLPSLTEDITTHLYRIASEAINNAAKHANPERVDVRLEVEDGELVLTVRDDGVGLPEERTDTEGIGLYMMKHRAEVIGANLEIKRAEEGRTLVRCRLSLKGREHEPEQDSGDDSE